MSGVLAFPDVFFSGVSKFLPSFLPVRIVQRIHGWFRLNHGAKSSENGAKLEYIGGMRLTKGHFLFLVKINILSRWLNIKLFD